MPSLEEAELIAQIQDKKLEIAALKARLARVVAQKIKQARSKDKMRISTIIKLRSEGKTLQEIAAVLNTSRQRVHQLLNGR